MAQRLQLMVRWKNYFHPYFRRDRSQIVGAIERNYFFHRPTRCIQLESDKAGSLSATISLLGAVIKFQPSGRTTLPAF